MILTHPQECIEKYNNSKRGKHYNDAAATIYGLRFVENTDPFSDKFLHYIVAGLEAFDMKMYGAMGPNARGSFIDRLRYKVDAVKPFLANLIDAPLHEIDIRDLSGNAEAIITAYQCLSQDGEGSLHAKGSHFHVGTTKILHWIAPQLFLIIDKYVACAFKECHKVPYKTYSTQPGYDAQKYLDCLRVAQAEIKSLGYDAIRKLEPGLPLARLFDKVAFIVGQELVRSKKQQGHGTPCPYSPLTLPLSLRGRE